MIGKKVIVEYADQDERMVPFMPRSGTIVRNVKSRDWGENWYLVTLDTPFDYEDGVTVNAGVVKPIKGRIHVTNFLIRSRWENKEVGDEPPVPVFVLLVETPPTEGETFESSDYAWACWGMASLI